MKSNIFFVTLLGLVGVLNAHDDSSSSDALFIQKASHKDVPVFCDEEFRKPSRNDFEIIDYDVMNSEIGQRFVLVSIRNNSTGQRILSNKDLLGIFANCKARFPETFKKKLSGGETVTQTLSFGVNRFPIIKLVSDYEDIRQ